MFLSNKSPSFESYGIVTIQTTPNTHLEGGDTLSKELLKLEQRARQKVITDRQDIDRIMSRIMIMPFSYLRKDEVNYLRLREMLSEGFEIYENRLDDMHFYEILILIGYEPGNRYFDTPLIGERNYGKKFNASGNVRFIAAIIKNLSQCHDIHLKEFMNIELQSFVYYLQGFVFAEYKKKHISKSYGLRVQHDLDRFYREACEYLETATEECETSEYKTVGNLITAAVDNSCDQWVACSVPLEDFEKHITAAYKILTRLFMNGIRMALSPWPCRNKFCGILQKSCKTPQEVYRSIEFMPCFEPHK